MTESNDANVAIIACPICGTSIDLERDIVADGPAVEDRVWACANGHRISVEIRETFSADEAGDNGSDYRDS
ncbi:MAG: hypothetical protein ACJ796_15210 [Gemmatimonadaceae bacterium]